MKHLVDLDEQALQEARAELGTTSIKDTVNEALRRASAARRERIQAQLDAVAAIAPRITGRDEGWR
jgi:Arc/MetJ family transcription regulator